MFYLCMWAALLPMKVLRMGATCSWKTTCLSQTWVRTWSSRVCYFDLAGSCVRVVAVVVTFGGLKEAGQASAWDSL